MALAIATLCFCPPESEAGCLSASSSILSKASTFLVSSSVMSDCIRTSSITESEKSCLFTSCITKKLFFTLSLALRYFPSKPMLPSAGISPQSASESVLLPQPLSPISATTLHLGTENLSISSI